MNKYAVQERITEYLHDPKILRGLLALMVVVALILAAIIFKAPSAPSKNNAVPAYATYIHDHKSGMTWLVTVKPHSQKMVIQAMGNYKVPKGHDLDAWIKPHNGKPHFIGICPNKLGKKTIRLSGQIYNLLSNNPYFEVTVGRTGVRPQSFKGPMILRRAIDHRVNTKLGQY